MRIRPRNVSLAVIACVATFTGCTGHIATGPVYVSVSISPRPSAIPQGTSVTLTATISNNSGTPQWSILDASSASNPGTLSPISGSPNSILYTAPPGPPIYVVNPTGISQGTVTLDATVTGAAGASTPVSPDSVTFVITSPTVSVSLAPLAASVPLGGTQQFIGYVVGSVNANLIWQVNGVTGGSGAMGTGTINTAGTYVAPSNFPMSGNVVTVTMISQADPTKTASAVVTLQ
jgi:hypothetical protein